MQMIRHAVNGNHFVILFLNYSGDVFVQVGFPIRLYETFSVLNDEYKLQVDLCVSIGHNFMFFLF